MTSIHVDLDSIEWTPGSAYKGPDALYQGQEVFYRKVLSDRRQEGGGLAVLSKICPPPGKMVKTVAVARSEEHVFNLRGGRVNKSGKPIEAPGNSYTLNPTGQPHSAMIATENIALVIYSGETDDVKSVEIVDIEPALGGWHNSQSGDDRRGKAAMRPGSEGPVSAHSSRSWPVRNSAGVAPNVWTGCRSQVRVLSEVADMYPAC